MTDYNTPSSQPGDFDFIIGSWQVHHRRLVDRLAGSIEWAEFAGSMTTRKTLGGFGNIEDNFLDLPGGAYRAVALRSFDAATGKWAIWWLDSRFPHQLDVPVVGSFDNGVGTFFAEDTFDGRPIKIRFIWTADAKQPRWEQAFSPDGGASWETNWVMEFTRADA
jgi:hypothetical protein